MKPGKVIRIGKVCFLIREINFKDSSKEKVSKKSKKTIVTSNSINSFASLKSSNSLFLSKDEINEHYSCKICLENNNSQDNPLLDLCKCQGSVKYIHLFCLKSCFRTLITVKKFDNFKVYSCKKMRCTVCKEEMPYRITYQDKDINLLFIDEPNETYMTLEYLKELEGGEIFHIYWISFGNSNKISFVLS